jgi:hypothetical protein
MIKKAPPGLAHRRIMIIFAERLKYRDGAKLGLRGWKNRPIKDISGSSRRTSSSQSGCGPVVMT